MKECRPNLFKIAGRLPENGRNSFGDLQSKKTVEVKKTDQKILFSLKDEMLYFD